MIIICSSKPEFTDLSPEYNTYTNCHPVQKELLKFHTPNSSCRLLNLSTSCPSTVASSSQDPPSHHNSWWNTKISTSQLHSASEFLLSISVRNPCMHQGLASRAVVKSYVAVGRNNLCWEI